jgi:arylsulfatase A
MLMLVIAGNCGAADKPNIVFILADDVGREVLGCYGGSSYRTPNLDRLAATGAKFEHCYSMPVCHPTRVTLLTGRYPRHLGNPKWGSFPKRSEKQTFAHVAKDAGYATAVAGKWQICLMKNDLDHPRRLGFDEWSVFGWHEGARYHEPMIYQNGKVRTDTAGKYGPDLYVDYLVDFMKRNKEKPFLAFYSMALCHDVTDDIGEAVPYGSRGRYDNYKEMAEMMDVEVGRLVKGIDDLGIRDNTLILFTTDNGTAGRSKLSALENGKFVYENVVSKFNGEDIPGGKGDLTDWGTRVPTIANWPGVIKSGQTWNDLVDFSDVLPTFAELTGGTLPAGVQLDGHSFAGLMTNGTRSPRKWAYAESRGTRFFAKTQRWKLYNDGRFFDTENDPFEKRSVPADQRPAASTSDFKLLRAAIDSLNARTTGQP